MKIAILESVEIIEYPAGCDLEGFSVEPVWKDVACPQTDGYGFKSLSLAKRFKKAIESGKIWESEPIVKTDMYGRTYVHAITDFSMRHANSELKKLGF